MATNPFIDVDDNELSDDDLLLKYAPTHIGPVWDRDSEGNWVLPERTLGWACAAWCADYLQSIDRDANQGDPFRFTLEQLRFLLWWYAVDERGKFVYREGVLQRVKGWGKDPLCAVLCLLELCGPVRFAGWNSEGQPVGTLHPFPWVQVAAVSQTQTINTMSMFMSLVTDKLKSAFDVKVMRKVVYARGGVGRIMAVTSSPESLQGNRSTFVLRNETQHWYPSNGGFAMRDVIDGNATKMDGRILSITNAPDPSKESVAFSQRSTYDKQVTMDQVPSHVLYDSLEAPAYTPMTERAFKAAFVQVRGDAVWLSTEATWKSVMNPDRPVSESRRMYLNQLWAPDDALYQPGEWDRLRVDGGLEPGDEIVLGFDGGKTDDATVLVAMRVSDCLLVPLLCEERPDGPAGVGWLVDREKVDSVVASAFDRYRVSGFYADVNLWESHILQWGRTWGARLRARSSERDPIGFDMRSMRRATMAHEAFMSAVLNEKVHHNGDMRLRRHVLNCFRNDTRWGVSFQKESRESRRKVDLYAGAMLAYTAWADLVGEGRRRASERGKSAGRVWFGGRGRGV